MRTKLHDAAKQGNLSKIRAHVSQGVGINEQDENGDTAIYLSASHGQLEAVKLLVSLGADINKADLYQWTPVWAATSKGHAEIIKELASLGADINSTTNDGFTPVFIAAENGQTDAIKTLASLGADIHKTNKDGETAVFIAADNGQVEVIKILASLGADLDLAEEDGWTPLFVAARNGHIAAVEALALLGADINRANINGQTPLMIAKEKNNTDVVNRITELLQEKQQQQQQQQADDALKSRLAQLDVKSIIESAGTRALSYSMLMMVGAGRAGKTGLRNVLLGRTFEQTDSTLGMAQEFLQLRRDELQVGESSSWSNFDRKNYCEQKDAVARMLAEYLRNQGDNIKPATDIQDYYQSSSIGLKQSIPTLVTRAEPTLQDEEPTFDVDENLVLEYYKSNKSIEPLKLTLWDFGGQEVFYSMHHLFLKRCGVYLVVFNMEWLLPQADPPQVKQCLELISFWLRSIRVHTQSQHDPAGAPVFLVGTHKDIVNRVRDHEHIDTILYEHFGLGFPNLVAFHKADVSTGRGKLWFYPVDNTQGTKGDRVLSELMKDIENTVRSEEYIKCGVPLEWMAVVDKLRLETRKSMTLAQFEVICKRAYASTRNCSTDEVQLMLKHFSNLGMLMYHRETGLGELVVTNPVEFLVGAASKLICDPKIHFQSEHMEAKKKKETSWNKMIRYGIVSSDLMKILWSHDDYRDYTDELELLMVKFGLIVPIVEDENDDGTYNISSGGEKEYFVPSLLDRNSVRNFGTDDIATDDDKYHQAMTSSKSLTFFIMFGTKSNVSEWQKSGMIKHERAEKEGFLPHGILCRLIGKVVAQSQLLGGFDFTNVKLKGAMANGLSFGDHEFSLREMGLHNLIRVDVHVDNLMVVMSSLQLLVQQAVAECVPNLDAVISAGYWEDASKCIPSHFVLIYGPNGLHDRVEKGNMAIPEVSKLLEKNGGNLQTQFCKHLPPMGELTEYDVFISYRWGEFDSDLAQGLFYSLSRDLVRGSQTKVFLDRQRLSQGKNFVEEFMGGIFKSRVVVPIISVNSLRRMASSAVATTRDNVLVEWSLALQLEALGIIGRIYPIFVGEMRNNNNGGDESQFEMSSLFSHREILDHLSDQVPTIVVEEVCAFLSKHGLKETEWLKTATVSSIVKKMLDCLGTPCWDIVNSNSTSHGRSLSMITGGRNVNKNQHGVMNLNRKIYQVCSKNVMAIVKEETMKHQEEKTMKNINIE